MNNMVNVISEKKQKGGGIRATGSGAAVRCDALEFSTDRPFSGADRRRGSGGEGRFLGGSGARAATGREE